MIPRKKEKLIALQPIQVCKILLDTQTLTLVTIYLDASRTFSSGMHRRIDLSDSSMSRFRNWKKSLKDNKNDVKIKKINQLDSVFKKFNSGNHKQLFELYFTGDVLQMEFWLRKLTSNCYNTFGLDCSQFYAFSFLSWKASLKLCESEIMLLNDCQILVMREQIMCGGPFFVFSSRLEVVNKKSWDRPSSLSKNTSCFLYLVHSWNLLFFASTGFKVKFFLSSPN